MQLLWPFPEINWISKYSKCSHYCNHSRCLCGQFSSSTYGDTYVWCSYACQSELTAYIVMLSLPIDNMHFQIVCIRSCYGIQASG